MVGRGLAAWGAGATLGALLAVTGAAGAAEGVEEAPEGIRGAAGPVAELSHEVELELFRGHARWTATRRLTSDGAGEVQVHVPLPGDEFRHGRAVPVGLAVEGDEGWIDGELFGTAEANRRYVRGGGLDPAAAVLSMGSGILELSLSGLEGRRSQRVRYEMLVPLLYDTGAFRMTMPALPKGPMRMRIVSDEGTVEVDGRPRGSGTVIWPKAGTRIALVPRARDEEAPLTGAVSVVPFGDRFVTHVRLEVDPQLSVPPKRARVVILLDASRSVPAWLLGLQVNAARAYLSHLPDAEVEVIRYARHAERRFGRFVSVAEAERDLATWTVPRGNGTELARALRLARELLEEDEDDTRPRRIIAFNDGALPRGVAAHGIDEALEGGAPLTHFGLVDRYVGDETLVVSRAAHEGWRNQAAPTGGMAFDVTLGKKVALAAMRAPMERLVRPVQLDELTSSSAAWLENINLCTPFQLHEGEGSDQYATLDAPTPWLRLDGLLWNQKVSTTIPVSPTESRVRSALAFGANALPQDDAQAFVRLAHEVNAVTFRTSLQAGHARNAPPGFGTGHGQLGRRLRTIGCGASMEGRHPGNRKVWLENALRVAWYDCGGSLHRATVTLDTAFGEIHGVGKPKLSAAAPPKMAACLQEAVWDVELSAMFAKDEERRYEVEVKPIFW